MNIWPLSVQCTVHTRAQTQKPRMQEKKTIIDSAGIKINVLQFIWAASCMPMHSFHIHINIIYITFIEL